VPRSSAADPITESAFTPSATAATLAPARGPALLVTVATLVNIAVAVIPRHFPYGDTSNQLARYTLMDRFWFGPRPPDIAVHLVPSAYIGVDLVGVALVHLFGALAAGRILAAIALALLPFGLYRLISVTAPARRAWALAGVVLGLNWFLLQGMLSYTIGMGAALLWLAWWWPRRGSTSWGVRALLTLGALVLYLVHLVAPLVVLVVIWVDWFLPVARTVRDPAQRRRAFLRPELATILVVTVVLGALWIWVQAVASSGSEPMEWPSAAKKLLEPGAPFFSFSLVQAAVMAGAYGVTLLAFLYSVRRELRLDTFTASAVVFFVLFLIFPESMTGGGGVDIRWLLPAYLLPFAMTGGADARAPRRALTSVVLAGALAHAIVVLAYARAMDPKLDEYDQLIARIPAETRVLPIIANHLTHPRVDPYQQYAFWHIIRNRGEVPGLWSYSYRGSSASDHEPKLVYFRHFDVLVHPYLPAARWGTTDFSPLDWDRISRDYDYIIQAGDDERAGSVLRAHATEKARVGVMTLYEVGSPVAATR
jgi:MFS family permease